MGMFDYVELHVPVDGVQYPVHEWQTKSLDCELATYRIGRDGRLMRRGHLIGDQFTPAPITDVVDFYGEGYRTHFSAVFKDGCLVHIGPEMSEDDWAKMQDKMTHAPQAMG